MEECGEEGRVREAQDLNIETEKIKAEIERLREVDSNSVSTT